MSGTSPSEADPPLTDAAAALGAAQAHLDRATAHLNLSIRRFTRVFRGIPPLVAAMVLTVVGILFGQPAHFIIAAVALVLAGVAVIIMFSALRMR